MGTSAAKKRRLADHGVEPAANQLPAAAASIKFVAGEAIVLLERPSAKGVEAIDVDIDGDRRRAVGAMRAPQSTTARGWPYTT
jgi:hypothetical protein